DHGGWDFDPGSQGRFQDRGPRNGITQPGEQGQLHGLVGQYWAELHLRLLVSAWRLLWWWRNHRRHAQLSECLLALHIWVFEPAQWSYHQWRPTTIQLRRGRKNRRRDHLPHRIHRSS